MNVCKIEKTLQYIQGSNCTLTLQVSLGNKKSLIPYEIYNMRNGRDKFVVNTKEYLLFNIKDINNYNIRENVCFTQPKILAFADELKKLINFLENSNNYGFEEKEYYQKCSSSDIKKFKVKGIENSDRFLIFEPKLIKTEKESRNLNEKGCSVYIYSYIEKAIIAEQILTLGEIKDLRYFLLKIDLTLLGSNFLNFLYIVQEKENYDKNCIEDINNIFNDKESYSKKELLKLSEEELYEILKSTNQKLDYKPKDKKHLISGIIIALRNEKRYIPVQKKV